MNKTYRTLQKRVYETIYPKGIPLEFGTKIEYTSKGSTHMGTGEYIANGEFNEIQLFTGITGNGGIFRNIDKKKIIKILGKELQLQDVLRVINKNNKIREITYFDETELTIYPFQSIFFDIDLSLPISAQSEKTLNKILDLIV